VKPLSHLSQTHQQLISQVQYNCDISDANHAGNYTLCIYLLKMREYYRWIHALEFADNFTAESMTQWLRDKEDIWDQVVDKPFKPLQLYEKSYQPFDSQPINVKINQHQLYYHAGIGQKAVQHFFIADLIEQKTQDQISISITGQEYARDLTAPPALSTQDEIVIRQESLKRMCWERYQEWHWSQLENTMGTAMSYYPFEDDITEALAMITTVEQNTLIQHELGEMQISREHGADWSEMMLELLGSKAELLARGVRDHLADCLSTLPFLIEQANEASIHFYFANLTYIRKDLFPSAIEAYSQWTSSGNSKPLLDLTQKAATHWRKTLLEILTINDRPNQNQGPEIITLIEQSRY